MHAHSIYINICECEISVISAHDMMQLAQLAASINLPVNLVGADIPSKNDQHVRKAAVRRPSFLTVQDPPSRNLHTQQVQVVSRHRFKIRHDRKLITFNNNNRRAKFYVQWQFVFLVQNSHAWQITVIPFLQRFSESQHHYRDWALSMPANVRKVIKLPMIGTSYPIQRANEN